MRKPIYVALFAVLVVAVTGRAAPEQAAPRILVVDLNRIIEETAEGRQFVKKLNEEMAAEKKRLNEELQKLQQKVKALSEAQLADRTPEFYDELRRARETQARLEMDKDIFLLRKNDEISRAMNQLLLGAQQEAKKVMRSRGADLVLVSKTGPIRFASDKEFQDELIYRRVLCDSGKADITDDVIAAMNEWWKENRAHGEPLPRDEEGGETGPATSGTAKKKE